ncbi:hypothetical protein KI387_011348, partial [Taxus chinensis]
IFCRGSKNDTRGFSCGLWLLFHSLSVRIEDGESMTTFTAICDFVHTFFICEECREHFSEMCSRVQEPIKSRYEFVLWLWHAHNEVNERLMVEEASLGTGDPKFPKMIWPPKQLCASCWISSSKKHNSTHVDVDWNNTAVYQFLLDFYGRNIKFPLQDNDPSTNAKSQTNLGEDTSPSNAVAVPIGAAIAIAIASCGFGAAACYWRMQQKKRKNLNQLYSFKDI